MPDTSEKNIIAKFWHILATNIEHVISYTNHLSQPKAYVKNRRPRKNSNIFESKSQLGQRQKVFWELMGEGTLLSQKSLTSGIELGTKTDVDIRKS